MVLFKYNVYKNGAKNMKILKIKQEGVGANRTFYVTNPKRQKFWEKHTKTMTNRGYNIITTAKWISK
jgi:hypothetical protein